MASFKYRNKRTKKVATYAQPNNRLKKSKDWEEVTEPKAKPKPTGDTGGQ